MNTTHPVSRRTFLQTTGKAAAVASTLSAAPTLLSSKTYAAGGKGPNDIIGIGHIGLGTRGGDLINATSVTKGARVVAVCDVYTPHLKKGIERSQNSEVKAYTDYHDLLADPRVDAVVIAAPDHWHCQMVLDAVKAGKDIYCEKGWALTLDQAKQMRAAIKQSGVVFQLGHQARAATCALQAKELIAEGKLGPITLVRTGRFGNLEPSKAIWRWYGYYNQFERPDPAQVIKDVNWEAWVGPLSKRPFHEQHFWHWRCYWDYGTGQAGDLLSHELDFVQYLLGYGVPDTCMCAGFNALLKDGREVPDTWNAIYQHEKQGCTVTFSASMNTTVGQPVELCGKEAVLRFNGIAHDATGFDIIPEKFNKRTDLPKSYERGKIKGTPNHMVDFLDCMRTRGLPKCHVDEAFIETTTYLMSVESYHRKRQVRWDPAKEQIV